MNFPSRDELKKRNKAIPINYQDVILDQLKTSLDGVTEDTIWHNEPDIKIEETEKQKEFFWIRIYLLNNDNKLKRGDELEIKYVPTNEKLEMIFGGYEKKGLNRNHDDEVINYSSIDDKKILICMIDINRVNKDSEDIKTIRTFFRNSRHYVENIFYKDDIVISKKDDNYKYNYSSIAF